MKRLRVILYNIILIVMYSGNESMSEADALNLLQPAVYYQIKSLREACETKLCSLIAAKNVVKFWRIAYHRFEQCEGLKNACEKYLTTCFRDFAQTQFIVHLTVTELLKIIQMSGLDVTKEEQLCEFVVKWFQHDLDNRKQYLHKVFKYVRFPMVDRTYWKQLKWKFPALSDPTLKSMVEKADTFHAKISNQTDFFNSPGLKIRPNIHLRKTLAVFSANNVASRAPRKVKALGYQREGWSTLCKLPRGIRPGYATTNYGNSSIILTGIKLSI